MVWSETEPVEIGECEELLKHEDDGYYSSDIAEKLQKYEKLTWCCPDPEEMYRIPFVSFVGEAPNPWIPVENRDIISLVIDKYDLDLFPIKKGGKFGYATEDGKVIIPCKWMDAKAFSEGYAAVMDENGMYGYIGKYGDIVIQCEWKDAKPFKDGFAEVLDEYGEWWSINKSGRIFSDGLADMDTPKPVAIEVREQENSRVRYKVLLIMEDGEELEVKFKDRPSRLIYIYTLLHPQGFQRRSLTVKDYRPLRELYSNVYCTFSTDALLKSINSLNFDQYFNQAVSQARVAIRNTINNSKDFEIARPQQNNGKTIIDFVANGGEVILPPDLR